MDSFLSIILALLVMSYSTSSQQLAGWPLAEIRPDMSEKCQKALNSFIDCPLSLEDLAWQESILDDFNVNYLCDDKCAKTINTASFDIASACTGPNDYTTFNDVKYPATYLIDRYQYAYNLSCARDSATNEFCDPIFLKWSSQSDLTREQACSDCWLSVRAMKLNHPFGYDEYLAADMEYLTNWCNESSAYEFAVPDPYPVFDSQKDSTLKNETITQIHVNGSTKTLTQARNCSTSYSVQNGETCHDVARKFNVSSFALTRMNNIDLHCHMFENIAGSSVCIPSPCSTYTWKAEDICEKVVDTIPDASMEDFLEWNPFFNERCSNRADFIGAEICLSKPGARQPANHPSASDVISKILPSESRHSKSLAATGLYTFESNISMGRTSSASSGTVAASPSIVRNSFSYHMPSLKTLPTTTPES